MSFFLASADFKQPGVPSASSSGLPRPFPVLVLHPACNLLSAWLLCILGLGTLGRLDIPAIKACNAKGHWGAAIGEGRRGDT